MGNAIINSGNFGADSDELSAYKQHVLEGYTAVTHDSDGESIAGTMPSRGIYTAQPNVDDIGKDSVGLYSRIPYGYYGQRGSKTGYSYNYLNDSALASAIGLTSGHLRKGANVLGVSGDAWTVWTGEATAEDSHVLSGKTYWKQGAKRTGTMASMAGQTITPSANQQTIACSGKYMTGNITVGPSCRVYSYDSTVSVLGIKQISSISHISIPVNIYDGEYVFLSLFVSNLGFPRGSSELFKIGQANQIIFTYSEYVKVYFNISSNGKTIVGKTLTPTPEALDKALNTTSNIYIRVTVVPYLSLYK